MVTIRQWFSVVTNPVSTVNDGWPVIILSADISALKTNIAKEDASLEFRLKNRWDLLGETKHKKHKELMSEKHKTPAGL